MIELLFEFFGQWFVLRRLNPFRYIFSSKYRKATHQRWRQQSPVATMLDVLACFFTLTLCMLLALVAIIFLGVILP